jgi:hypothetical protein
MITMCSKHPLARKTKDLEPLHSQIFQSPLFLRHGLTIERVVQPALKLSIKKAMLPIYRVIPRVLVFLGRIAVFKGTPICHCLSALCSVSRRI